MKITYRSTTNDEQATLKCCVLQDNQMQCNHKAAKIVTIDDRTGNVEDVIVAYLMMPVNYFVNLPSNDGVIAYCQAHFNILASNFKVKDGDTVVNLDEV